MIAAQHLPWPHTTQVMPYIKAPSVPTLLRISTIIAADLWIVPVVIPSPSSPPRLSRLLGPDFDARKPACEEINTNLDDRGGSIVRSELELDCETGWSEVVHKVNMLS